MKQQLWKMFLLTSCILSVLSISGCGGSSTPAASKTVSGTALAGAPIVGNAYLKDANGVQKGPVTIDKDGNFSFDVTGLQAPFILEADGTAGANSYRLCSMSTGGGTANINPITNLAVAVATGKDPTAVFTDPATNNIKNSINDAAITDAITKIKAMLAPILTAYNASAIDPLKDSVKSTNSGMDGVFDVVKIDVTPSGTGAAQVSIDNKLTNTNILPTQTVSSAVSVAATTAATITTATTGLSTDADNLKAITLQLQALATELAKTTPNLESFYASNYGINSGRDRAHDMADLTPDGKITGLSPLTIVRKITNGTSFDYEVSFKAFFSDGSVGAPDDNFIFTNEAGVWKLKGNGFKSSARVQVEADRVISADGTSSTQTGLRFEVEDPGLNGIASVTITGPGLPADGLIMGQPRLGVTFLEIGSAQWNSSFDREHIFTLSDATITSVFAATAAPFTFTFVAKDAKGATVETRTRQLAAGPLPLATLNETYFPTLSGVTSHALSGVAGQSSLTVSFTKPTAYTAQELRAELSFFSSTDGGFFQSSPLLTATQTTIVGAVPSVLQGATLSIHVEDSNRRRFMTAWIYQ